MQRYPVQLAMKLLAELPGVFLWMSMSKILKTQDLQASDLSDTPTFGPLLKLKDQTFLL